MGAACVLSERRFAVPLSKCVSSRLFSFLAALPIKDMKTKLVLLSCFLWIIQNIAYADYVSRWDSYALGIGQSQNNIANDALAQVEAREEAIALQKQHEAFIPEDPWRTIDGQTNYIKNNGVEFCGKILEVQPNGVRISGDYGELFRTGYFSDINNEDRNQEFFVANFPFEAAENELIPESHHWMAYYAGTYTYQTVNGNSRTIRKLDYGIPCDPPKELIKEIEELNRIAAQREQQKEFLAQSNAVVWLQSQATNGDAESQCSLGEHYLTGLGCNTNRTQAVYWFTQAANQGDLEASNKLAEIQISR
jgi:hypothetical protein